MKIKLIVIASLLLVGWLGGSCASGQDFDAHLDSIVEPYRFSIAKWEFMTIPHEVNQWIFDKQEEIDGEIGMVTDFFTLLSG